MYLLSFSFIFISRGTAICSAFASKDWSAEQKTFLFHARLATFKRTPSNKMFIRSRHAVALSTEVKLSSLHLHSLKHGFEANSCSKAALKHYSHQEPSRTTLKHSPTTILVPPIATMQNLQVQVLTLSSNSLAELPSYSAPSLSFS